MKKYIFLAVSALTLASCQTDDFLGDTPGNNPSYAQKAISFGGTTGKISRAELNGADAAEKLHNSFIVYGTKTVGENSTTQTVFNQYTVSYDATKGWTYENTDLNQSTKYWDYAASKYDFYAFSLAGNKMGEGENEIKVTKVVNQGYPTFTLKGKVSALKTCYTAAPVSVASSAPEFGKTVKFTFSSNATTVSVGIYETIPGYDIQNIKFYKADNTESTQPVLYASSECISSLEGTGTGTMTLTFGPSSVTTDITLDNPTTGTSTKTANLEFTGFSFGTTNLLGTDRISATKSGAINVSVPSNIEGDLTMKVDYTLISTDGSDETITVHGATVKVPKNYTNWEPNHHYTYIFKITDKTNGSTGGTGTPSGLNPIVFDAIVSEEPGGSKTTEIEFNKDGTSTITGGNTSGGNINGGN